MRSATNREKPSAAIAAGFRWESMGGPPPKCPKFAKITYPASAPNPSTAPMMGPI